MLQLHAFPGTCPYQRDPLGGGGGGGGGASTLSFTGIRDDQYVQVQLHAFSICMLLVRKTYGMYLMYGHHIYRPLNLPGPESNTFSQ